MSNNLCWSEVLLEDVENDATKTAERFGVMRKAIVTIDLTNIPMNYHITMVRTYLDKPAGIIGVSKPVKKTVSSLCP